MVTMTSNSRSDLDILRSALYSIPADCDYETWWKSGAALKSELGEDGYDLWVAWSRQSANPNHQRPDFRACWRSARLGAIGIGTLYHFAKEWGWRGQEPGPRELTPEEKRRRAEQRRREEEERKERGIEAAWASHTLIESAVYDVHPYLTTKGFPEEKGLVSTVAYYLPNSRTPTVRAGDLLLPMRHHHSGKLQSLQSITPEGAKKFFPNGVASKATFRIGRSGTVWYVEGYATALSVRAGLQRLYRHDSVVVCISAAKRGQGRGARLRGGRPRPLEVRGAPVRPPLGRSSSGLLPCLRFGADDGTGGPEVRRGHRPPLLAAARTRRRQRFPPEPRSRCCVRRAAGGPECLSGCNASARTAGGCRPTRAIWATVEIGQPPKKDRGTTGLGVQDHGAEDREVTVSLLDWILPKRKPKEPEREPPVAVVQMALSKRGPLAVEGGERRRADAGPHARPGPQGACRLHQ